MKLIESSISDYIKELASSKPVPGGGSASALVLSLGLGLFSMCLEFSKKKMTEDVYRKDKVKIKKLIIQALELVDHDKIAYGQIAEALKLPGKTDEEKKTRKAKLESGLKEATLVPLEIVKITKEGLYWYKAFIPNCNPNIISDLYTAISFLKAAYNGGVEFIDANLKYIKDKNFINRVAEETNTLKMEIQTLLKKLVKR